MTAAVSEFVVMALNMVNFVVLLLCFVLLCSSVFCVVCVLFVALVLFSDRQLCCSVIGSCAVQ